MFHVRDVLCDAVQSVACFLAGDCDCIYDYSVVAESVWWLYWLNVEQLLGFKEVMYMFTLLLDMQWSDMPCVVQ